MYKYLVEYLGVFVIVMADFLTHADPAIMGLTYFSVLTMAHGITSGYFNPFVTGGYYILGHIDQKDALFNLLSQIAGGLTALLFYKPVKVYVD